MAAGEGDRCSFGFAGLTYLYSAAPKLAYV
jgi:hypothetical protein